MVVKEFLLANMIVCQDQCIGEGEKVFLSTDILPLMTDVEGEKTASHHQKP